MTWGYWGYWGDIGGTEDDMGFLGSDMLGTWEYWR